MIKNKQTKLHNPPYQRGNCFATIISCFLDCEVEEVPPFENMMDFNDITNTKWIIEASNWLLEKGYEWGSLDTHGEGYYIVIGNTPRSSEVLHCCIYKKGELWHDPHPDGTGLINEKFFEYIKRV